MGRRWYTAVLVMMTLSVAGPIVAVAQTNTFPASGSVGIGTTTPQRRLHVLGDIIRFERSGTGRIGLMEFYNPNTTANNGAQWDFLTNDLGGIRRSGGRIEVQFTNRTASTVSGAVTMWTTNNSSVPTERLRITETGNIGIGTTAPTARLHVAGDAKVDGNIAAKYQDVAEWVRAAAPAAPGTLVIIDPTTANRVRPAESAYDMRVAGVVSALPGIILGDAGPDKVKVAHSGRVRVKVDSRNGAISIGDMLVASATPGHAMRSEPVVLNGFSLHRPGTIVGKALEAFPAGQQGEILVLLVLQ
jgi:hypothetical protein